MESNDPIEWHANEILKNPNLLQDVMMRCFVNDTEQIKTAEQILKKFTKNPRSFPILLKAMEGCNNEQVRQLAAVLLKKKIKKFWPKLSKDEQSSVASTLLQIILREPGRAARNSMASFISELCGYLYEVSNGWPELFQFIAQCSEQTQSEDHRELAFILLLELVDSVADELKPHLVSLKNLFMRGLSDPSPKVQAAALQSYSNLLSGICYDQESLIFADLIPASISIAQHCIQRNDEEIISTVMEVFTELSESTLPLVNPYLPQIIDFVIEVMRKGNIEMSIKDTASLVLVTLAENKPKALGSSGKIPAILSLMVEYIASHTGNAANALFTYQALASEDDDEDDDESFDGPNTQSIAQSLLDSLALNLNKEFIFQPTMELCTQCFIHQNPHVRKAACAIIGVMAEGCNESIRMKLEQILVPVLAAAQDPEPAVRECACFCLGQLSEHCQPDILQFHSRILPVIFERLDDEKDNVKGVSCYVLEMFCENLQPDTVLPFLDPLMNRLIKMLQTPKRAVQEMSVAAIAATAIAAEKAFVRFLPGTMLNITDESMLTLKGRALECMGHIAIAVDLENFRPYVNMCMQSASESLKIENTELHEFAYTFFANLAKVLGAEMAPFVNELVPHLINEINKADVEIPEDVFPNPDELNDGDSDSEEESEEELDDETYRHLINVRTAELDKKKSALLALGAIAEHSPVSFEPFLPNTLECLKSSIDSAHSELRREVCDILKSVASVAVDVHHPNHTWVPGQEAELHPQVVQLNSTIIQILLDVMNEEKVCDVVAHACEALRGTLEKAGPMVLKPHINDVMLAVANILAEKAPCQTLVAASEISGSDGRLDEEDEILEANETDLNEGITDLIGGLARVIGPSFVAYFDTFLPLLINKTKQKSTDHEKQTAMGAIGEVLQAVGSVGPRYLEAVLPVIKSCMKSSDSRVLRNTCFCTGIVAEGAKEAIAPHVMTLLQLLAPVFRNIGNGSTEEGLLDNAAAAVARIIMAAPQSVPMDQVLPGLLGALPLKIDEAENETVYGCLICLLNMEHPVAISSLPSILTVLAKALSEDSIAGPEMKNKIVSGLTDPSLVSKIGAQMSAAFEQVSPDFAQILKSKLGG